MDHFLSECLAANKPPFLQNPQGWKFFLDAVAITPDQWIGTVHIHMSRTGLSSQVHGVERRRTRHEALKDARTLAEMAFIRIGVRFKAINDRQRRPQGMTPANGGDSLQRPDEPSPGRR
jgi:hypothetical protein